MSRGYSQSSRKTILVTGASGFIGQHLLRALASSRYNTVALTRGGHCGEASQVVTSIEQVKLAEVACIIHLAGLAHAGAHKASTSTMFEVNVEASIDLFQHALAARIPRFVWLSTIKVLGNASGSPLQIDAPYQPGDIYAESKMRAELGLLQELKACRGPEVSPLAIVRPPLVYGSGVKANFLSMLKWGSSGWPLPLGNACAPRSWVAVDNLVSVLMKLTAYRGQQTIWHVRDEEETSVVGMLRRIASLSNQESRLLSVPVEVIKAAAKVVGRAEDAQRLLAPLRVDMEVTRRALDWRPPVSQANAMREVVSWYHDHC